MPQPTYRYPWPASAIEPKDMALLHSVRESSEKRVPISVLVARAVRATYGQAFQPKALPETQTERKEAA